MMLAVPAVVLGDDVPEAAVKAAFLYKFGGYVQWPAQAFKSSSEPFVIGVLGDDEIASRLEQLTTGRSIAGRRIEVTRLDGSALPLAMQMLFVAAAGERGSSMVRRARRDGLLIVTQGEEPFESGAAINLVVRDGRVGFEIAPVAAERSGLHISSRMLSVARRVVQ